ncbi:MAG: hypothetical protein H7Z74_04740 [Anaerolineae bacterium]|nr:hypothetical protein [Gemmatimonadaceae bacterium]
MRSLSRHRRVLTGAVFVTLTGIVGARAWQPRGNSSLTHAAGKTADTHDAFSADLSSTEMLDADIAFYGERVAADPSSAGDHAKLAALFLERVRVSGSQEDAMRAEQAARTSLAARTKHNGAALALLASSLLEQHRFIDAREAARQLVAHDSVVVGHRALLAEIELELGNYDEAARLFGALQAHWRDLAVAPRVARWMEIRGGVQHARQMLAMALKDAIADSYLPRSQVAWFHYRLGDFELRYGRHEQARAALAAGLKLAPGDYRLLGSMAGLEAAEQRWDNAIEYAGRSVAVFPDPAVLGLLSNAYLALGDTGKSSEFARAMAVLSLGQPGAIHRTWSAFWLDRGEHVEEVLVRAQEEGKARRDIYGDDVLAWALHKTGRHADAKVAMARALVQGVRDPSILFHAATISYALGDTAESCVYLHEVLVSNPRFLQRPVRATPQCSISSSER